MIWRKRLHCWWEYKLIKILGEEFDNKSHQNFKHHFTQKFILVIYPTENFNYSTENFKNIYYNIICDRKKQINVDY